MIRYKDSNFQNIGVIVFDNLFKMAPDSVSIFQFKDKSQEEYKRVLRGHSSIVLETLNDLVYDWGSPESMRFLKKLGCKHVNNEIILAYFSLMFTAQNEAFMTFLGSRYTHEMQIAWQKCYDLILI